MTTILALIASYLFFSIEMFTSFGMVFFVGIIQFITKKAMTSNYQRRISEGLPADYALSSIPNGLTTVNMVTSFVIYGMFIYSVVVKFF